jgi:hypothetical protein
MAWQRGKNQLKGMVLKTPGDLQKEQRWLEET